MYYEADSRTIGTMDGSGIETEIIGRSPAIAQVLRQVASLSQADVPVMIEGETGTGKDVAARTIHGLSARRPLTQSSWT